MSFARWFRRIAAVSLATALVGSVGVGLRSRADAEREWGTGMALAHLLAVVHDVAHSLDAGAPSHAEAAVREIERALAAVSRRAPAADRARLAAPLRGFLATAREQAGLLARGQRGAAQDLDRERLDPLEHELASAVATARAGAEERARAAQRRAARAFWAAAYLALAALAWLMWALGRTRIAAAARAAEQRSLRESERRFRHLFEANPQPMWVHDLDTLAILEVNEAALSAYGWSREEMLRLTLADLTPEEDRPRMRAAVARDAAGPQPPATWRHLRRDGTAMEVEVRAYRMSADGRRLSLVLVTDLSERRRLEDELRQAQKMEAVGRLAGGVAHDFNNLITAIQGYTDLIRREVAHDPRLAGWCDEVLRAGQRAASLTRQLLAFSRRQRVKPACVDLNAVLVEAHKMLVRLLGEDIDLVTSPAPGLGAVIADAGQIEQVILNLAVNARDAMPAGGRLTIETADVVLDEDDTRSREGLRPGPHVMLAVTDTGSGIEPEMRHRIFEPFFTTKEPGKGTGLGLATVYAIVRRWNGAISVHSEIGQGTTFRIHLPLAPGAADPPGSPLPASPPRGHETVLLVEDEAMVRDLAQRVLERAGYRVLPAPHAEAALEVLAGEAGPIHLLLTDLVMPGLRGWELAQIARSRREDLRLLFMSGYPGDAALHGGVHTPDTRLLPKPFTADQLLRAVRAALDDA